MQTTLLRPLGFGELLDGAFTIYRRHFVALFATALLVMVPLSFASWIFLRAMVTMSPTDPDLAAIFGSMFLILPVTFVGYMLVSAALTRLTACAVTGQPVSIGDGYAKAGRRLLALVGAVVLIVLISAAVGGILALIGGIGIAIVMLATAVTAGATGDATMPAAVALVGTIVITVGMLMLMLALGTIFFAVVPAVVIEGSSPTMALNRSWQLSRGARLRIVGVLFVVWLIVTLPTIGLAVAAGVTTGSFTADPTAGITAQLIAQQLIGLISNALTWPFFIGCLTLLYFDRRVRTEAYDLEAAAEALPANS